MSSKKDKKRKAADAAAAAAQHEDAAAAAAPAEEADKKKKKKDKKAKKEQQQQQQQQQDEVGAHKPSGAAAGAAGDGTDDGAWLAKHPNGRRYTVTMAVPGSIIDNTQSFEMANFVAGQVARTAAVFNVDELVVIDDTPQRKDGTVGAGAAFLARVVQYLETPQYLRRALVPMHSDLRLAGLLPPLDAPHHARATEWLPFREGVVLKAEPGTGSFIDVGLDRTALAPRVQLRAGARVTVRLGAEAKVEFVPAYGESMLIGEVVPLSAPREEEGLYWGYTTRLAKGVSGLLRGCPFAGGYDLKLGTSERGQCVAPGDLALPRYRRCLVAFGGPDGLEAAMARDKKMAANRAPHDVFDLYLNTCPGQGSRTIRTEEAVLISMAFLQTALGRFGER